MIVFANNTMPQNYFVTGLPKAGKTTILWKLAKELKKQGLKTGGFLSPEEKHHGSRTAFHVVDIETGKEAVLADIHGDGPKVSKYHVSLKSFESIAVPCMKNCRNYDVFFIDEIGSMEMKSAKFGKALDDVLDSRIPLIASINGRYLPKFRPLGNVIEVTPGNRGLVHKKLLEALKVKNVPERKKKISKNKVRKSVKKKSSGKPPVQAEKSAAEEKPKLEEKQVPEKAKPEKAKSEKGILGKIKGLFGL